MAKHTPEPWACAQGNVGDHAYYVASGRLDPKSDMTFYDDHIAWVTEKANAQHIVRAVNAFPKLLAALKELQVQADSMNNRQHAGLSVSTDDWAELFRFCNLARSALAEAEPKESTT